jgi:hypothetical protein
MKRTLSWTGYKVQVTETCDDDAPHLITHVKTCPAMQPDSHRRRQSADPRPVQPSGLQGVPCQSHVHAKDARAALRPLSPAWCIGLMEGRVPRHA